MEHPYSFAGTESINTPALIYYYSLICDNTQKAIQAAHGADRLWPHIKSHKSKDMIQLSLKYGITKFKCATIAEAETAALCGASHVIVAYPLVGPNIARFLELKKSFPQTHFYAVGDNLKMVEKLGNAALSASENIDLLVDVNMGMNRTGVALSRLSAFCTSCAVLPGITLAGLHCYDGHRTESDFHERKSQCDITSRRLLEEQNSIRGRFPSCSLMILGGSPSFPCHRDYPDAYFSPGTLFIYDYGYAKKFPDLPYTPAAAILTRVISCPERGIFTLDLGYKGIAADPHGIRGLLLGIEHYEELFQSEEHWTFRMNEGYEEDSPKVGDELFVIPTHICPTSALYPEAIVVKDGNVADIWPITARNRKINI